MPLLVRLTAFVVSLFLLASCAGPEELFAPASMDGPSPSPLRLRATAGDGTAGLFELGNGGGRPLAFDAVSSDGWLTVLAGHARTVDPGARATVLVTAGCTTEQAGQTLHGTIKIVSDDPARPTSSLPVRLSCLVDEAADEPVPAEPVDPVGPVEPQEPEADFGVTLQFFGSRQPTASQRRVFEDAAARWAQVIVGDLPDRDYHVAPGDCFGYQEASYSGTIDDVLIFASVVPMDGEGGALASAGPCILRRDGLLPLVGLMQFDEADFERLDGQGLLRDTVLHEMAHVLGFGTVWEEGRDLLDPRGSRCRPNDYESRFNGAEAIHQHEQVGGHGRPYVETGGGYGTACGHWLEEEYVDELMTGWIGGGMRLSRMTVGSFGDLGYTVDASMADDYRVPAGLRLQGEERGERLYEILLRPTRVAD